MRHFYPVIPYFQTTRIRINAFVDLAQVKLNEKVADLGSGDGRIAIALAQKGAHVTGYELDTEMISIARENINKARLENNIQIRQKDFWGEELSEFDVVVIYPMPDIMDYLEKKLSAELKPGSRILTNYYTFSKWKEEKALQNIHLYIR